MDPAISNPLSRPARTLSIVVPAFNEEDSIDALLTGLQDAREKILRSTDLDEVEIVLVNDGSQDRTGEKVEAWIQKGFPTLRLIHHQRNEGYGAALKTGFHNARGAFLSFMDADGTIDPNSYIPMYQCLIERNADMIVGKRFGSQNSKMPAVRRLGNWFFASLLSVLSGTRVRDSASGMRLFRSDILDVLYPLPDGLHFTPAMSSKAVHEKFRIEEVDIPYTERTGQSKLSVVKDGVRFLRIIVGTVLLYNPFKVFLLIGLSMLIVASALLADPMYTMLSTKEKLAFTDYIYRSIGAVLVLITAVQVILFGILARFIVSTFFRAHESGRFIHKLNRLLDVYKRMPVYGLIVAMFGASVPLAYGTTYVLFGTLDYHWGWLLFASTFVIIGCQMIWTGVIMRILKDIKMASA